MLDAYLAFLEREMVRHPESIIPLSVASLARAQALVGDLDVNPDEDLGPDVMIES